jgi:hypothetical protein
MEDGISHMSAMAKSRMQAELMAKVKLKQANTEGVHDSTDTTDAAAAATNRAVSDKIKNIEVKLEKDKFVPLPTAMAPTAAAASTGGEVHNGGGTLRKKAEDKTLQQPPRRKLYDSLFEEKTLSEKERQRRQFLFGIPSDQAKPFAAENNKPPLPLQEPKVGTPPPPPPKTVPAQKEEAKKPPTKTVSTTGSEKKPKKDCCIIL